MEIEIINGRRRNSSDNPSSMVITEWRWVDLVTESQPSFDVTTQNLQRVETLSQGALTISWSIVAKTQAEQDTYADAQAKKTAVDTGFDTGLGYSLAVEDHDQNAFSRLIQLMTVSGKPDAYIVPIKDISGTTHTITFGDLKTVLIQYGQYCMTL